MSNNSTAVSNVIPFRSAKLLLVEKGGQPFVPMKPVVEGMGLAWQAQHAKLTSGRFNSVITMIVTTGVDGKQYEMTCLPLRKLPGWLMSIHPNKVRPELREGIITYQNECDDVLWSYWNNGVAVRKHDRDAMTVIGELIGMSELSVIKGLIRDKSKAVQADRRQSFTLTIHSRLHTRFNVPRTELIPAHQFESACNFIAAYALEGEYLGREEAKAKQPLSIHYPVEVLARHKPEMVKLRGDGHAWLDVSLHDLRDIRGDNTPCEAILIELRRAGYEVDGAWWELRTYRNKMQEIASFARGLTCVIDEPHRYAIKVGDAA
ncbi:hypothetical protein BK635_13070 [Pseudomonas chlororaphis]|nr:hypothetical protein BK635_13070 [Pseudomonas chlororaphis]